MKEYIDKKIKAIESKTKSLVKDEKSLLKADKKRDAVVKVGEMVMKNKPKHPSKKKHHSS